MAGRWSTPLAGEDLDEPVGLEDPGVREPVVDGAAVAPELEKLAEKYDGKVDVVKVDVDANPGLSRAFNIMSIPTIAFFPGEGKQPMGVMGFQPAEQLESRFGLAGSAKPVN